MDDFGIRTQEKPRSEKTNCIEIPCRSYATNKIIILRVIFRLAKSANRINPLGLPLRGSSAIPVLLRRRWESYSIGWGGGASRKRKVQGAGCSGVGETDLGGKFRA